MKETKHVDIKPNARELYMYFIDEYIRAKRKADYVYEDIGIIPLVELARADTYLTAARKTARLYNVMQVIHERPTKLEFSARVFMDWWDKEVGEAVKALLVRKQGNSEGDASRRGSFQG